MSMRRRPRAALALVVAVAGLLVAPNVVGAVETVAIPVSHDCGIRPNSETPNCSATTLSVGSAQQKVWVCTDVCGYQMALSPLRSALFFDLSAVPAGSDITAATLSLYAPSTRSSFVPVSVQPLLGYWTDSVTWFYEDQTAADPWETFGGDADPSAGYLTVGGGAHAINIDVLGLVQEWVGGVRFNFGMLLNGDDGQVALNVASKENATAAQRPMLNVSFVRGTPPATTLSGDLYDARDVATDDGRSLDGGYVSSDSAITVQANEGSAGQGVKSVEMLVDGARQNASHLVTLSCGTACPASASATFTMAVSGLAAGEHTVTVIARDPTAAATSTIAGAHVSVKRFVVDVGAPITVPVYTPPSTLGRLTGSLSTPSVTSAGTDDEAVRAVVAREGADSGTDLGRILDGHAFTTDPSVASGPGGEPTVRVHIAVPIARLDQRLTCADASSGQRPYGARLSGQDVDVLLATVDVTTGKVRCVLPGPGAHADLDPDPGMQLSRPETIQTVE
jgi:Bacterial Ig domain